MQFEDSNKPPEWKTDLNYSPNRLHTLCSYMAMFPPSIPSYFIKKYSKENDIVLDQFSGRGTTALEACSNNRIGIGSDRNPLAYVLTSAKVNTPSIGRVISKIESLESEYDLCSNDFDPASQSWEIRMLFSDSTLRQLLFLRERLDWEIQSIDAFVTAMILGILHGKTEGYLSISMPNTFSMSPRYIKKYIEEHGLEKPERNVFQLLKKKAERCYQKSIRKGRAYRSDARSLKKISSESVKLVMTSPPYTRVIRYGDFNWIRLWFLGKNAKEVDKKLHSSQSLNNYKTFMTDVLEETMRVLKSDGTAVFVIGDVKDKEKETIKNLAEFVWENCAKPLGFELKEPIYADAIRDNTKVTKIWGKRRGQATKIDRFLILRKTVS